MFYRSIFITSALSLSMDLNLRKIVRVWTRLNLRELHACRMTLFFAKKSGIVLVEMADRAGSGSSEFHIELQGHGAEWSR